jgi:hypothetical protein
MTGKRYYMTTLGDWQRHAARFANSHFIVLDEPGNDRHVECGSLLPPSDAGAFSGAPPFETSQDEPQGEQAPPANSGAKAPHSTNEASRILVLIEADEGVHLSLEDEAAFEALPHPLAQQPISEAAQSALAPHGVASGATTFDAMETLARVHPLLRHRVF